jgi:hypothetical protein
MKPDSLTVREAAKIPFEFQRGEIARTFRQVVVAPTVWHNYLPHHPGIRGQRSVIREHPGDLITDL